MVKWGYDKVICIVACNTGNGDMFLPLTGAKENILSEWEKLKNNAKSKFYDILYPDF